MLQHGEYVTQRQYDSWWNEQHSTQASNGRCDELGGGSNDVRVPPASSDDLA